LFDTTLRKHDEILGTPWLHLHQVQFDYLNQELLFAGPKCSRHSTLEQKHPTTIAPLQLLKDSASLRPFAQSQVAIPVTPRSLPPNWPPKPVAQSLAATAFNAPQGHTLLARWYDWKTDMKQNLALISTPEEVPTTNPDSNSDLDSNLEEETLLPLFKLDICVIGAMPLVCLARWQDHKIYTVTMKDVEKALHEKSHTYPKDKVPSDYWENLKVFSQQEADVLPKHCPYDHKIITKPSKEHGFGPLYGMSQDKLLVLQKYLEEHLAKRFISASLSPVLSPVIFARKPGGGLRFCIDYWNLNEIAVKNWYPIPLIQENLNCPSKAKYLTKLDIISAFNWVCIKKGQEWLAAFCTWYDLFEYLVMPLGMANAPSTFQHYVNNVPQPYLDVFCTAYIEDILIYSDNLEDHKKHVNFVLETPKSAGLQLDIDKCKFH
jgi:hypothetical protein